MYKRRTTTAPYKYTTRKKSAQKPTRSPRKAHTKTNFTKCDRLPRPTPTESLFCTIFNYMQFSLQNEPGHARKPSKNFFYFCPEIFSIFVYIGVPGCNTGTAHRTPERTHPGRTRSGAQAPNPTQPGRNPNSPEHRENLGAIPRADPQHKNGARSDQTAGLGGLWTHSETIHRQETGYILTGATVCNPCPKQWTGLCVTVILCGDPNWTANAWRSVVEELTPFGEGSDMTGPLLGTGCELGNGGKVWRVVNALLNTPPLSGQLDRGFL